VVIPIPNSKTPENVVAEMNARVDTFVEQLEKAGVRVVTDTRSNYTPG
jgi:prolyl-tRNA synthetase